MQQELKIEQERAPYRALDEREMAEMAEVSEMTLYYAAMAKFQAGFVRPEVAAWLRAAADRIEKNGLSDELPTEWDAPPMDQMEGL